MKKLITSLALASLLVAAACGSRGGDGAGVAIKSAQVGSLTVTLSNPDGVLRHGEQELMLTFKDATGKPVEVGAASLAFHMPAMGTMAAMHEQATLTTTSTPGVYRAKADIGMAGEWQAQVAYEGAAGAARGSFPVTAQ